MSESKFTKDYIKRARNSAVFLGYPGDEVFREALDEIVRLNVRIEELEAVSRWIPVSEWIPESVRVLVHMSNHYSVIATYFGQWQNDSGQVISNVTHWRPLPDVPVENPQEEE